MRPVLESLSVRLDFRTLCALSLFLLSAPPAGAEFSVVARDGDPIPESPGTSVELCNTAATCNVPVIDETGAVYFTAGVGGTGIPGGVGAVFTDGPAILLRTDGPIDGIDAQANSIGPFAASPQGISTGLAVTIGLGGGVGSLLHLRNTGATEVLGNGDPVVGGNELALFDGQVQPTINEEGKIAYAISLEDTTAGTTSGDAMFLYDPSDDSQRRIITEGQSFPSGDGTFAPADANFAPPELNAVGQAVFRNQGGIFLDDQGVLREIAIQVTGQFEDGFTALSKPRINASGHVAFRAKVRENGSTSQALYIWRDEDPTQRLFNGNGIVDLPVFVRFNDRSEVIVNANLSGFGNRGLIVFDGTETHTVAQSGEAGPGGGTWLTAQALGAGDPDMVTNAAGQVLFIGTENMPDGSNVKGAYVYDPPPLSTVTRILAVGDSVEAYEVTEINAWRMDRGYYGAGALNDAGQAVLNVDLDGPAAIVRYDPGPTAAPAAMASAVRLGQNVPNPFNPHTELSFELRSAGHVRVEIFDLSGRRVRTLVDGVRSAGEHEVVWRGLDDRGEPVASGVYLYRVKAAGISETKRMVLVR